MGQVREPGFRFLDLADIGEHADIVADAALGIVHGADGQQFRIHLAGLATVPDLALPMAGLAQGTPDHRVEIGIVPTRAQHHRRLSDNLLLLVTGHPREGLVHRQDPAVRIGDHDAFVGALEHRRREARLGLVLQPLADVEEGHHRADHAARSAHRVGPVFHRQHAAVGAPEHLVVDMHRAFLLEGPMNRAFRPGIGAPIRMVVMHQFVHLPAHQSLAVGVAEQAGTGRIGKNAAPFRIDAVDRLGGGFKQQPHQFFAFLQRVFATPDGLGHAVEGLAQVGQFIAARQFGARVQVPRRQPVRGAANALQLADDKQLGEQGHGNKGRQHEPEVLQHLLAPHAHDPFFDRRDRHLDADQAAQFAGLVAESIGIALADHPRCVGRVAVAFQAMRLHPQRRGVMVVGSAVGGCEGHETLRALR